MRLSDWIFHFVHGFRYASKKVQKEELEFLQPFKKEQMLQGRVQVEAIQFSKPYRLVLLCFFDQTKQDLLVDIYQGKWSARGPIIDKLIRKYSALKIDEKDLRIMLERCRKYYKYSIYAIDFAVNICCLCWTRDPREKGSPLPWDLSYITKPQETAEMIFSLNLSQASMYCE